MRSSPRSVLNSTSDTSGQFSQPVTSLYLWKKKMKNEKKSKKAQNTKHKTQKQTTLPENTSLKTKQNKLTNKKPHNTAFYKLRAKCLSELWVFSDT